jgi:tetratricopeptide (TPR) repeat protein
MKLGFANTNAAIVFNARGVELMGSRRIGEALESYDRALALNPDFVEALNNRGNALRDLGRPDEALTSYDRAIVLQPLVAELFNNRGGAFADLKKFDDALIDYDKAIALRPFYPEALCNRGGALLELKRPQDSLAACDSALALVPDFVEALTIRGNALRELNRMDEAIASYDRAIAFNRNYAEAYESKGIALSAFGRVEEAVAALENAITLMPRRTRFYYHLSLFKRFERDDLRIAAMDELLQESASLDSEARIFLLFALGKAYADLHEHARSFRHFIDGNALKRRQISYPESADLQLFERMRAVFSADFMRDNAGSGDPSSLPLFIVGMPRSGTTLVEQILASHPQVFGGGEIDDFANSSAAIDARQPWPENLLRMSGNQFRELGSRYIRSIKARAPAAERVVDKMMLNFRFLGLIHLALPNARIIHVHRDPRDTCVSCFSILFQKNLNFSYDLKELGRYYSAYAALMAHWRDVLPPGIILDVQYEDLVNDLDRQARRIVAHCGLEWDAHCFNFHRTERLVRTASATQVRQPIYKTSIGRWRAYEAFLGPLFAELGPP